MQELMIEHKDHFACWCERRAEVEFICEIDGIVIPIEVKSGWVVQAKSLRVFSEKYLPPYSVVFSARNLKLDDLSNRHNYPLYLASIFPLGLKR